MLIDWFTVAAQGVNFLILVWLLKRFLYEPVLNAIDAREKRVAAQLTEAATERSKAQQERSTYESRNASFDTEREQLLSTARSAAEQERQALLQKARAEYESLRAKLFQEFTDEHEELTRAIVSRVLTEVFAIARRLMGDLSDRNLEERIVEIFVRRLHSLSDEDRAGLRSRLAGGGGGGTGGHPIRVRSAFELSASQRAGIESELKQVIATSNAVEYEQAPELLGGIELTANGYRLRWSIEDYLGSLRQQIDLALRSASQG
jgi:F-type H+-transporting ATPase subunit b